MSSFTSAEFSELERLKIQQNEIAERIKNIETQLAEAKKKEYRTSLVFSLDGHEYRINTKAGEPLNVWNMSKTLRLHDMSRLLEVAAPRTKTLHQHPDWNTGSPRQFDFDLFFVELGKTIRILTQIQGAAFSRISGFVRNTPEARKKMSGLIFGMSEDGFGRSTANPCVQLPADQEIDYNANGPGIPGVVPRKNQDIEGLTITSNPNRGTRKPNNRRDY